MAYTNMSVPSAPLAPSVYDTPLESMSLKTLSTADERMRKLTELADRYEISTKFAARLRQLEGYEIVFICDDSGSMATAVGDLSQNAFAVRSTRWDELKQIVSITVEIASVLDPDGIDIYFLNRPPVQQVTHSAQLLPAFAQPPRGPTPITRVLRQVLDAKRSEMHERKLLIIIATDGQPTDDYGTTDIESLQHVLENERNPIDRIPVTFCACTDDEQAVGYLNRWDRKIPFLDVCDDYRSERAEIQRRQGANFPFSFGDYVVKVLLGSIDSYFDTLDSKNVNATNTHGCCSLM